MTRQTASEIEVVKTTFPDVAGEKNSERRMWNRRRTNINDEGRKSEDNTRGAWQRFCEMGVMTEGRGGRCKCIQNNIRHKAGRT